MYKNVAVKSLQSRVPLVGKVPIIADVLPVVRLRLSMTTTVSQ